MQRARNFIHQYFQYLLYFLLLVNLVLINKVSEHRGMLENKWSPHGILSLELSFSQDKQDSILSSWDNTNKDFLIFGTECKEISRSLNALSVAHRQNNWDCLFIIFYTALLGLCYIKLYPSKGPGSGLRSGLV